MKKDDFWLLCGGKKVKKPELVNCFMCGCQDIKVETLYLSEEHHKVNISCSSCGQSLGNSNLPTTEWDAYKRWNHKQGVFCRYCFLSKDLSQEQVGFVKGLRRANYTLRMIAEVFCKEYKYWVESQGIVLENASGNQLFGDDLFKSAGMNPSKE